MEVSLLWYDGSSAPGCLVRTTLPRISLFQPGRLTNHEPREKGIDPTHDQCLRYHHGHVSLHHAHHPFHGRWICHRIRRRFAPTLGILEECSILERRHQVRLTGGKR